MTRIRRRGRGEGSIRQLADGRYQARLDLGWIDGKRRQKAFYGRTREAAQRKLTAALNKLEQGLPVDQDGRLTVGQWLTHWLTRIAEPSVRPRTFHSYEQTVRLHLLPSIGRVPLVKLTPEHVDDWMSARREAGDSVALVRYGRAVLRVALNVAVARKHVAWNVAAVVKPPKLAAADRRAIQPFTPAQAQQLLAALRGRRNEALVTAALATGLRLGEALGLRNEDLDLDAGIVQVRRQLQAIPEKTANPKTGRRRQRLELVELKTAKSRRTIPLPAVTVAAFKAHRVRQLEARLKAGPLWQDQGLVFTTRTGGPIHPRNALRDFQAVLKAAGLPIIRFHDLRHTLATLLLVQGVAARTVMETLGHSQIGITLDLYQHVLPIVQRDAATEIDRLLTPSGGPIRPT